MGVRGLSSVVGIIHWGMGSMLSSTTKPCGGEQRKRALNPFPRATSHGMYAKSQSTFSHMLSSLGLSICSAWHIPLLPSLLLLASGNSVSLLPVFSTSLKTYDDVFNLNRLDCFFFFLLRYLFGWNQKVKITFTYIIASMWLHPRHYSGPNWQCWEQ